MKNNSSPEPDTAKETADLSLNRREFLELAGAGIFFFFTIGDLPVFAQEGPRRPLVSLPQDFNAFLRIKTDGRVDCFTGKIEMGQGVITSLAQMLADELDIPFGSVDMVMGDTDLCPWDMGTFGSMSTRFFGPALRAAGAEARLVLMEMAAEQWKTSVENLSTNQGIVINKRNRNHRVTYGELAQGKRIERHLTGKVSVKNPAAFRVMSKPALRTDSREKVTGTAKYAADIQAPGMVYAKILRPPAHGAKLIDIDLTEARRVKGIETVQEGDFVALLHKYPDVAELALSKINARYDTPATTVNDQTIFDHLLKVAPEGAVLAKGGDLEKGATESSVMLEETYFNDYVAHAPIEPHAAVAHVQGDKAIIWASTQTPFPAREEVARSLGIEPKNVRVMPVFLGGGFGGKSMNRQIIEAARLSKRVGKPVQVAWSRGEEFFYDSFRPAAIVKIKSGLTNKGRISLWDYHVYYAGERGAPHFYNIENHSTVTHGSDWVGPPGSHPFATGPWRAPGNNTNTFARESQIDIMAVKAGMDPVEFRMQNLTDAKMLRVLWTAAQKFGWKPSKSPSDRGFGVACGIDAGTYVTAMAEVALDKTTGEVLVRRVVIVQDMGLAINPEGAAIQMEGAVMMGLGYALKEQVRFRDGEVLDRNFNSYSIPRFSWLPSIETVIIDDKDAAAQGGGEPAIVTTGAVIANAVYDASGVRSFRLPMTPKRIKEAMKR